MVNWDGLNRRKFPRVSYPCLVIVRNKENKSVESILAHTENVGIGGVCVILKQDIKVFSNVEIEIDLLDLGEHVKCKGKIVWNVQRKNSEDKKPLFYDIGIEFQDITDEDRSRFEKIVQRLVKNNKEAP